LQKSPPFIYKSFSKWERITDLNVHFLGHDIGISPLSTVQAQPDVVLFSSLCKACALASRWAQASQLFLEATRTAPGGWWMPGGWMTWITLWQFTLW
jgi:hypothetical protein